MTVDWSPNDQPHTCCEQLVAGERRARVGDQEAQQVELAAGQRERLAAAGRRVPAVVDDEVAVGQPAGRGCGRSPARRSTESTRSASSRGLNGLVT